MSVRTEEEGCTCCQVRSRADVQFGECPHCGHLPRSHGGLTVTCPVHGKPARPGQGCDDCPGRPGLPRPDLSGQDLDPDAMLAGQRAARRAFEQARAGGGDVAAMQLASVTYLLDCWLSQGRPLPSAWQAACGRTTDNIEGNEDSGG